MTTNVPKGAGRPAAQQRAAKHAQRTPLPPRKGSPGAEAIAARKCEGGEDAHYAHMEANGECPWNHGNGEGHPAPAPEPETPMAERTVAELRKTAQALGVPGYKMLRRGDLLNAILEAEKAKAKTEERLSGRDLAAEVFATVEKSKPATPAKAPKAKAAEPKAEGIDPGKAKSLTKAQAFLKAAEELGWERVSEEAEATVYAELEDVYGVSVARGDERISIEWRAGVFVGETCYHSHPLRTPRKVINASAAKKIMAIPAAQADEEARKVSAHKSARPRRDRAGEATTTARKALPFDVETASDEEILKAVAGREITCTNSISGAEQSARVTGSRNRIVSGRNGARAIDFNSPAGACTVRLSSIVSVR
jgi:hypothetical protein